MQYRIPFLFDLLGTFFITLTEFGAIALVLQKFDNIDGWGIGDISLLIGMVNISFGLMDMIFSGFDPAYFGKNIRLGSFDQLLLRPVNIIVQVFGSDFALRRLGRIGVGIGILGWSFYLTDLTWNVSKILVFTFAILGQIAYFGGLFMIGATITFWTVESIETINIFTYGGTELISYPMSIYPVILRRFFTYILPAIFLNYYPALFILGKPDKLNMPPFAPWLAPIAGVLILTLAIRFWNFGLAHYQSTGT